MNTPKYVIKLCDMPPEMERGTPPPRTSRPGATPQARPAHHVPLCADAIEMSMEGLDKFNTEKEVAQFLRKAFVDKVRPPQLLPAALVCTFSC